MIKRMDDQVYVQEVYVLKRDGWMNGCMYVCRKNGLEEKVGGFK